ncbi:MAG: GTP pyrophosphokinase, partial [Clostridia bacterium]|nr:GTP pyrophosphokinase [Clostridia bacterium]
EIVGFITRGRGVSVHRKDCVNMLAVPDEQAGRIIPVEWELSEGNMHFEAEITIIADDRKGLFSDCSKVCEDMDISITSVHAKTDNVGNAIMNLTFAISNTGDIEKVIARIRQIKDVIDVYRTAH